jgi:uncharacterized protein YjiS (DUF1127 family)
VFAGRPDLTREVALPDAFDHHYSTWKITVLEPLREPAPVRQAGQCPFLARAGRATTWLFQTISGRRNRALVGAIDDHTLSDIGVTRLDAVDWGPKS